MNSIQRQNNNSLRYLTLAGKARVNWRKAKNIHRKNYWLGIYYKNREKMEQAIDSDNKAKY